MDTLEGTVGLQQEESLEAVITMQFFFFFFWSEIPTPMEIMCGGGIVNGMLFVVLLEGG